MASLAVLEAENMPSAAALARLLRASSSIAARAPVTVSAELLRQAHRELSKLGMGAYAAAAQWAAAKLENNVSEMNKAVDAATSMGVQAPEPFFRMLGIGRFTDETDKS
jgi:hypothetical protein